MRLSRPFDCPALPDKATMPARQLSAALLRATPQMRLLRLSSSAHVRIPNAFLPRFSSTIPPANNHDLSPPPPVLPWKTPTSVWAPENLIAPPKEGEVLLERRPNRALPPIPPLIPRQIRNTLPIFIAAMLVSLFAFFNYQKTESSVVTSTLYALRTNPRVRAELGDEIYFASKYPWVKGEINQVHGRIDISFWVKGTKAVGQVKLRCRRRAKTGLYFTQEWSLEIQDGQAPGRKLELYDPQGNAIDPFGDLREQ